MSPDAEAVAWLDIDIRHGDDDSALEALQALGRLGFGQLALERLKEIAAGTDARLAEAAGALVRELASRIGDGTPSHVSGEELERLLRHEEPYLRFCALFSLYGDDGCDDEGELHRNRALALAREALVDERLPWLRAAAVRVLGLAGGREELDLLLSLLGNESHGRSRAEVLRAIGRIDPTMGAELALSSLDDGDRRVRRACLSLIAGADRKKAVGIAARMLKSLNREVREDALYHLDGIDGSDVCDLVLDALLYENERKLMEMEAAILFRRAPRSAIGAVGFLRRSMDDRAAEIASALYDRLLAVHEPGLDEIERLEREFLESRAGTNARLAAGGGSRDLDGEHAIPVLDDGIRKMDTGQCGGNATEAQARDRMTGVSGLLSLQSWAAEVPRAGANRSLYVFVLLVVALLLFFLVRIFSGHPGTGARGFPLGAAGPARPGLARRCFA